MTAKIVVVLFGLLFVNFATSDEESSATISKRFDADIRAEEIIDPINADARTADVDLNAEDIELKERNTRRSLFATAEANVEDNVKVDRKAAKKAESKEANTQEVVEKAGKRVSEIIEEPGRLGAIKIIIERVAKQPDIAEVDADGPRSHEKLDKNNDVKSERDAQVQMPGQESSSKEVVLETKGRMADASSENADNTVVSRQDTSPSESSRPVDNFVHSRSVNQMLLPHHYSALNKGLLNNPGLLNPTPNPYSYLRRPAIPQQIFETNSGSEDSIEQSRTPLLTRDMENSNAYPYEPVTRINTLPTYPPPPKNPAPYPSPTRPPMRNPLIKESYYPENFFANRYYPGSSNNYNPYGINTNFG